jgi:prolyl oligopeptidase
VRVRIVSVVLLALVPTTSPSSYPVAKRVDVVDVMHGVAVADPYRWLEELESDETRQWVKAQDELTKRHTAGESYDLYRARIERLANVRRYTTPVRRGDRWFFFETDSNGLSGRVLMMKTAPDGAPRPLVDLRSKGPDALARVLSPSPDGEWVAYGEALDGSRWLQLRLMAPATGRTSDDTLTDLHSSMGSIAWLPDGKSFLYVRFDAPSGPRTSALVTGAVVMQHAIGTPQSQDVRIFHLSDSPRRTYGVRVSDDGRWIVVTTGIGASSTQQVFVRPVATPRAPFTELFSRTPGQFSFLGSKGDRMWFLTSVDAPRYRIIRIDANRPEPSQWTTTVPQPDEIESITYANFVADRLIVMSTRDAAPRVRIHTLTGEVERELPLPPLSTVWGRSAGGAGFVGRTTDREAYFTQSGIADPGSIYRLDPHTGTTQLFLRPAFDFDVTDFTGRQVFYTAKDGTRIPMFIAHHKHVRADGARAAFMYGYGAFKWSAFPWFQPQILAWMEAGGVYALPGLRGGGEYGERWHEAAVREKKQTSVDDYIAAAEWLIANKYAAAGKVVANGGSISGAIAAAAVVQRPALFGAAVIEIPALDLLRYDRHSGAAAWIPEFGSPAVPREFHALRALSPYHNLKAGVCYPPTLVLAGEKDDIAVPSHAYKFVAALQQTQSCANPVLLQVAWGAGHTFGTSNESSAENWARQLAFVNRALKIASRGGSDSNRADD